MEAIGRLFSTDHAIEGPPRESPRTRTYDPTLADLFRRARTRLASICSARSIRGMPCSPLEPEPHRMLSGKQLDEALTVAADFHRPQVAVHGRAQAAAAQSSQPTPPGCSGPSPRKPSTAVRARRRLVPRLRNHRRAELDLGQGPGPLHANRVSTRCRASHPMLTEQMLRRSPALAMLNPVASAHHEKCDGLRVTTKRVQARTPTISAARASWRRRRFYVGAHHPSRAVPSAVLRPADAGPPSFRELRITRSARNPRARPCGCSLAAGHGRAARSANGQTAGESGRAHPARSRCGCDFAARGLHHAPRSPTGSPSPPQDRRSPHPAHLTARSASSTRAGARRSWAMQHSIVQ